MFTALFRRNSLTSTGEHHLRMAYCVEDEIIETAFDRMEKYFGRHRISNKLWSPHRGRPLFNSPVWVNRRLYRHLFGISEV